MKSEKQVRQLLQQTYQHRLNLRCERRLKKQCRNCKNSYEEQMDLGQLGEYKRWICKYQQDLQKCEKFECKYTEKMIEEQLINDIKDPSICGSKQPKIAVLLWLLHNNKNQNKIIKKIKRFLSK